MMDIFLGSIGVFFHIYFFVPVLQHLIGKNEMPCCPRKKSSHEKKASKRKQRAERNGVGWGGHRSQRRMTGMIDLDYVCGYVIFFIKFRCLKQLLCMNAFLGIFLKSQSRKGRGKQGQSNLTKVKAFLQQIWCDSPLGLPNKTYDAQVHLNFR